MAQEKCSTCGALAVGEIWEIRNDSDAPIFWTGGFGFPGQTVMRYCEEHKPKPPKKEPRKITDPYGDIVGLARMGDSEFGGLEEDPIFKIWEPLTKWTTTSPTKEGWYWAMLSKERSFAYPLVLVEIREGAIYTHGNEAPVSFDYFTHWLGPIPEPEPPND